MAEKLPHKTMKPNPSIGFIATGGDLPMVDVYPMPPPSRFAFLPDGVVVFAGTMGELLAPYFNRCPDCGEDIYDHCVYCSECEDADHSECERRFKDAV